MSDQGFCSIALGSQNVLPPYTLTPLLANDARPFIRVNKSSSSHGMLPQHLHPTTCYHTWYTRKSKQEHTLPLSSEGGTTAWTLCLWVGCGHVIIFRVAKRGLHIDYVSYTCEYYHILHITGSAAWRYVPNGMILFLLPSTAASGTVVYQFFKTIRSKAIL